VLGLDAVPPGVTRGFLPQLLPSARQ